MLLLNVVVRRSVVRVGLEMSRAVVAVRRRAAVVLQADLQADLPASRLVADRLSVSRVAASRRSVSRRSVSHVAESRLSVSRLSASRVAASRVAAGLQRASRVRSVRRARFLTGSLVVADAGASLPRNAVVNRVGVLRSKSE